MLFERTRYLFSMLGSYLSPSTLFAARPTSIILVGANEASSAFETIEVERVGGAQNQANGNGSGNGHGLEKGKERIGVKQVCPKLRERSARGEERKKEGRKRIPSDLLHDSPSLRSLVDIRLLPKSTTNFHPELVALEYVPEDSSRACFLQLLQRALFELHLLTLCCACPNPQPDGHLQTIYSVLGDFTKVDQIDYER
jgi:hypothetical protein